MRIAHLKLIVGRNDFIFSSIGLPVFRFGVFFPSSWSLGVRFSFSVLFVFVALLFSYFVFFLLQFSLFFFFLKSQHFFFRFRVTIILVLLPSSLYFFFFVGFLAFLYLVFPFFSLVPVIYFFSCFTVFSVVFIGCCLSPSLISQFYFSIVFGFSVFYFSSIVFVFVFSLLVCLFSRF